MTERRVREPAVAGSFYPADPRRLADTVDDLLTAAARTDQRTDQRADQPLGIVVPHAGYLYSGPVAASAYSRLRGAPTVGTVVLLGPAHYVPVRGMAVPACSVFRTPLGEVAVDEEACRRLTNTHSDVVVDDVPHEPEHAVEVQLPFVQRVLGDGVRIVPVLVGSALAASVADVVDDLLTQDAFMVVSTDLSHYLDDDTARLRDRATAAAVVARDPDRIDDRDACGAYALRGLLSWAARRAVPVELLDLRTSADTAGDPRRVVGYGAFAVGTRS